METPRGAATIEGLGVEVPKPSLKQQLRLALWKRSPDDAFNTLMEIDRRLFPRGSELRTFRQASDMTMETISSIGGAMDTAYERLPISFPFVLSDMVSSISLRSRRMRKRLRPYLVTENEEVRRRWEELA